MATKKDEGFLLDSSGKPVQSSSGPVRSGSYNDEKVTQNRNEAARKQLAEDVQSKLKADKAAKDDADFAAEEARGKTARAVAGAPSKKSAAKPAKSGIVTKEELAKSGLSLRDYMNKQRGLTRRDGKATEKAPAKAQPDSKAASSPSSRARPTPEGSSPKQTFSGNYSNEGRNRPAPATTKPELGPMAAGRYSPGYARQLDQTEQKRIGRLEGERIRDAENNAKRQAERDRFNEAMRNDPKQKEIRAAREKAEGMTSGQRSAERGKGVKEFFGIKSKPNLDPKGAVIQSMDTDVMRNQSRAAAKRNNEVTYKQGGSVSSASKRADGIATKGKTRCKVY